ncbi:type II toxin-antitoxin system VapB family antitoxin [Streptomyces sp. NRRL S-1448]|uniref:type II toxin-antitoxin system VapB family antitoxin n=1 Tax=Streptomyces sp. NRRL S-1448 TaxID=1463883 RepID=UPI000AF6517C|nr:type II toxin-antitoxin system VapB family antitoxin [Streptomyces sp. NRRL S-1448]
MTSKQPARAEVPLGEGRAADDEDAETTAQEASGPRPEAAALARRAQALAVARRLVQDGAIDLDLLRDKSTYRPRPGR